jgi:hypothetical protein
MPEVLDKPTVDIDDIHELFTDDNEKMGGASDFPDTVVLVNISGKYLALNVTPTGERKDINTIAAFPNNIEADKAKVLYQLFGTNESMKLEAARDIAASKRPSVKALSLQRGGKTIALLWVD